MKASRKRLYSIVLFVIGMMAITSCTKDNSSDKFTIIGPWGMVSGTITDSDGTTTRYDAMSPGSYYEYMEFKADGTLIRTSMPSQEKKYGVYTYNESSSEMQYKFDGDKYYQPASVYVISATEMNLTTDWGSVGRMTQYFVRVK